MVPRLPRDGRQRAPADEGLTPAEARTVVAATGGGAIEEIAERLAVSGTTVKTHLTRVYAKTGAGGRADLVRLILGLAAAGGA